MRGPFLIAALLMAACVTPMRTVTTVPTRRIAFTSMPTAPLVIQGSTGLSMRAHFLTSTPVSLQSDGAVAFPMFQPELGALVRLGQHSYLGGRISMGVPQFGVQAPAGSLAPRTDGLALDIAVSGGHDLHFTERFGLSLSAELGIGSLSVTRSMQATSETNMALPIGRGTAGLFFTPGQFRLYAGATVGTSVTNDATGTFTTTCQFDCTTSETGRVDLALMSMVGGGVRWQANENLALAAEAWLPLSQSQRLPPVLSLTLRVGDFHTVPPPPRPLPPPPPPSSGHA